MGRADTVRSAAGPMSAPRQGGRLGTARGPAGRCAGRRPAQFSRWGLQAVPANCAVGYPRSQAHPHCRLPVAAAFSQQLGRPPAGIARERETSADDASQRQLEFRTRFQSRMPRPLTAPPGGDAQRTTRRIHPRAGNEFAGCDIALRPDLRVRTCSWHRDPDGGPSHAEETAGALLPWRRCCSPLRPLPPSLRAKTPKSWWTPWCSTARGIRSPD